MTKIRVFPHNEKGKIEFTKEELQKLLNEVYNEGKIDSYTISYGSNIATTPYSYSTITASDSSTSINKNNLTSLTTDVKD
jgi:hypothetical protein